MRPGVAGEGDRTVASKLPPRSNGEMALLIVDMVNLFDFEEGERLAKRTLPVAGRIASLKRRFQQADAPVIYVNDNFTDWRADFKELVAICSHPSAKGARIVELLRPDPGDYYILKPKHSGFLATPLALLLSQLKTRKVVITGIAADACVLATAQEANMREYEVAIPQDCVAARSAQLHRRALALMKEGFGADTRPSTRLSL
jgi:nicotinamidase-related amidase